MTGRPLQLALREWQRQMTQPLLWATLLGIAVILALIGPFETDDVFSLPAALAYWAIIAVVSYGIGLFVSLYADLRFPQANGLSALSLRGAVSGVLIALPVTLNNHLAFSPHLTASDHLTIAGIVVIVSMIITVLIAQLFRAARPETEAAAQPPALLDRLPLEKRGRLLAISVEDHYVRVVTSKGEELVLMRFSDAIRETGAVRGDQVHRSHWVAYDAVASVTRNGAGAVLTLRNGHDVPVSRANMPKIKEAGLLPR